MASRFINGFRDAGRGIRYLFQQEIHFRAQAVITLLLLTFIIFLPLTYTEAGFIVFAITLVLASEAANAVIERIMDLVSMAYNPRIGRIKDMMAASVLINSMGAFAIGIVTMAHYALRPKEYVLDGNWDTALVFHLNSFVNQSGLSNALIIFAASTLAVILIVIFILSLALTRISIYEKINRLVIAGVAVVFARYGIVEIIRYFILRPRPFAVYSLPNLVAEHSHSFPSGHAASFFALSTAIFFWDKRLGMLFFLASTAMGIGRIAAGVHYPSDIIGGAAVGIASAWIAMSVFSVIKK